MFQCCNSECIKRESFHLYLTYYHINGLYITRAYSILACKDLKLQHVLFHLSPFLKWKQSQQLSSPLGSCMTDMEEGSTSSNHFSISPQDQKGQSYVEKPLHGGSALLPFCNCPLIEKEDESTNTGLITSLSIDIPHLLQDHCCLCNTKDEAASELQVEARDFQGIDHETWYECLHCHNKPQ